MVKRFLVFIFLSCFYASSAQAMLYQDMNIETMIAQSDMVFSGQVLSQETGIVDQKAFVETTFTVLKWYGQSPLSQVSIKQFARVNPKGEIKLFPGLPSFQKGQAYLMFLKNPTLQGFSSPVGLLTFELLAKSVEQIQSGSPLVRAKPNRVVKGLFGNITSPSVNALLQEKSLHTRSAKNQKEIPFDFIDTLLKQERP